MDVEIVDDNTHIEYQVKDVPDAYREVLLHYGFTKKNHLYHIHPNRVKLIEEYIR